MHFDDTGEASSASPPQNPGGFRYHAGWVCFIASFLLAVVGLLVPMLGLDKATATVLTGALVVGGPEIAIVLAVALWGKETFQYFMGRAKGLLKLLLPAHRVSPTRYRIGLVMLIGSGLPTWLLAYAPHWIADAHRMKVLASADLVFVASFFVLGGEFWGRLRALFTPPTE